MSVTGKTGQKPIMPSVPAEPPPPYVATTPMILDPGIKSIPNQPTELLANLHPLTIEIGTLPSGPNRSWFRDKTRDTVVSGYSNSQLGVPPISSTTIWLLLRQLKPPLMLESLSMDSRPASATSLPGGSYQDLTMYCRPTSIPIRSGNSNSDLTTGSYGILASRYKAYAEIVSTLQKMCETPNTEVFVEYVVEVPHYDLGPAVLFLSQAPQEHIIYYDVLRNAAVPPWPPPALSRLAHAPIQPCPPQVPRSPLSPHDPGILVSTQPLSQVYSTPCLKASRGGGR